MAFFSGERVRGLLNDLSAAAADLAARRRDCADRRYFMFRKAVKGPCPYCGKKAGPVYRPFNCRVCRQRVIVDAKGMSRLPS
ncbi:MAG TPA: hypothetical protein VND20_06855 [Candidatus Binataceae bacterium]|nr:hypothetical protein [Candidatus Binataceae bacterium]